MPSVIRCENYNTFSYNGQINTGENGNNILCAL